MTIDIIDLTDPEYSDLSPVQLSMVRVAQGKKNDILADAEEEKTRLQDQLIVNNFARSSIFTYAEARVDAEASAQVDAVREDLLYQLAYEALGSEGNEQGPYRYPENPNYNLSASQRFLVVRNYYMQATDDPEARLQAYAMDTLARQYLGEFYATLYDLLASYC
ncbi:MAG TPA: hypothetical protein H9683_01880 [Firmicutes bacterium]|nr:hypothetical protein [Bacillota bacterium]